MALFGLNKVEVQVDHKVEELIKRRRLQLLVHSCIYYYLNSNLISDEQFDKWGRELVELQALYPEIAKSVVWANAFKDWDASTGAFLPYKDKWVLGTARHLLYISKGKGVKYEHKKIQQSSGEQSRKKPERKKASKQRCNSLW